MRKLLAILFLIALPAWGQVASRSCVSGESDYITWGDVHDFGNGTTDEPFTLAMWVETSDWDANFPYVFVKYNSTSSQFAYILSVGGGGNIDFQLYDGSSGNKRARVATAVLGGTTYDNKWVFIAGTYNGNEASPTAGLDIYLNGVVVDDADNNAGSYTSMDNVTAALVTCAISNPANYRTQNIAYGSIYNRQLSASEINQIMHCPGSVTSGLVGYWPLTDSTTQYDRSSNKNNGTNSGTAASTDGPPISTNCAGAGGN